MAVPFTPPLPAAKSLLLLQSWPGREAQSGVPWAGDSWQHAVCFQRVAACRLAQTCLRLQGSWLILCQPVCALPPLWGISVAPEPLSPMEPGKAELLPLQHGSGWQRDVTKVMQGHSGRVEGPRLAFHFVP